MLAARLNVPDIPRQIARRCTAAASRHPIMHVVVVPSDAATVKPGTLWKPADQRQGGNEPDMSPRQPRDVVGRQ
jgi:hypothetical protein